MALFHGRDPIKPLDVSFNNRMIERFSPNTEYVNNSFVRVTTILIAGKQLFSKLDCSQAYHCVQMADDLSVQ